MSLQHSEARADRLREIAAADPRPSSLSAAGKHGARDRRRAATRRLADEVAEARALGVAVVIKPILDASWTEAEDAVVAALYPDYARMAERLPHRSRSALPKRADHLGLVPAAKLWTPAEVEILRARWASATPAALAAALPRWSVRSIDSKARGLGLKPRGAAPLSPTGDPLCDAIRDRCRVLGYGMADLDAMARTGTYFAGRQWRGKSGHRLTPMVRAVRALGGVLNVEWPD